MHYYIDKQLYDWILKNDVIHQGFDFLSSNITQYRDKVFLNTAASGIAL